jgi:Tfp pilus assembly protein PilF
MINSSESAAFANLGLIYYESDKMEQSALSYLKALEITPDDEETLCNLGLTLSKIKFNDYAKMAFEEAINVNPGNKVVLVNYLLFLLENKQFNKFASILTHASRILDPAEFSTYQKLYQDF